jgi:hypothetical protein
MTRAMKAGEDVNLPPDYTAQDLVRTPDLDPEDGDVKRLDLQPKVEDDPDEHGPLSLELINHNPTEEPKQPQFTPDVATFAASHNSGFSPSQNQGPFTPGQSAFSSSQNQGAFSSNQNHSPFQTQGVFSSPQSQLPFSHQSTGFSSSQNQNVFASSQNHGDVSPLEPEGPPESYFPQMPAFTADTAPIVPGMAMDSSTPHVPTPPSNTQFSTPPGKPQQFSPNPQQFAPNPQQFYAPPSQPLQMPPAVHPSHILSSSQLQQPSPPILQSPHGMQPPPQAPVPMMQPPPVPRAPSQQLFNAGPSAPPQSMMDVRMQSPMPPMQPAMQPAVQPMMGLNTGPMAMSPPVAPPQRQQQQFGSPVYRQDDESITLAENHSRYAASALAFNDVKTAVAELRKALDALGAT